MTVRREVIQYNVRMNENLGAQMPLLNLGYGPLLIFVKEASRLYLATPGMKALFLATSSQYRKPLFFLKIKGIETSST